MEIKEVQISSVVEYITEINKLLKNSKYNPNTQTAFFRGHANSQWELKPSLLRNEGFIEKAFNVSYNCSKTYIRVVNLYLCIRLFS